jgi:hypothetical protein
MKLKCPHEKVIHQEDYLGVCIFYHEDDTDCKLLNTMDTTIEDLAMQYLETHDIENSRMYAAYFSLSQTVRMIVYTKMSQLYDEALIKALQEILEMIQNLSLHDTHYYMKEMIQIFGTLLLDNIAQFLFGCHGEFRRYLDKNKKPVLPMSVLSSKYISLFDEKNERPFVEEKQENGLVTRTSFRF